MSLKESMKKANQNNWTNLPKNAKNQIKKFDFNRNNQNNSYKTINYLDVQYNNSKMLQKKDLLIFCMILVHHQQ